MFTPSPEIYITPLGNRNKSQQSTNRTNQAQKINRENPYVALARINTSQYTRTRNRSTDLDLEVSASCFS